MSQYETLLSRVHLVRRQWRTQVWVKGVSLFLAAAIALLVLGVWGADFFGFRPLSVWAMRVITGVAVAFVAVRFLFFPLSRRVTDVQIAQFIEERYPHLEDRLVSAVEFGQAHQASEGMLDLLIRDALDKISRIDFSIFVDRRRLAYFGGLGTAAFLALYVLLSWGPSFFPYGFNRLYVPWTSASIGAPMMITVTPGDLELAKGSDAQIRAQLIGYDAPEVTLYVQNETATAWTPMKMEPERRGSGFLYLLIDVQSSLNYYVEAKGVRSQSYTINVLDVPHVEKIDLTYNFPAYTGMAPQTVENEGDISALKGTKVDIKIHVTRPAQNARLMFDDKTTLDLARAGNLDFAGSITLRRSGSYVVQFADRALSGYKGSSSEYEIEALDDMPPKVTIPKPMRDTKATNVDEVFSEIRGEDDIGMGKVDLRYSINGAPEKSISLYNGKPSESIVTAPHTFFMEEFGLQPGDIISYYGWASDNNNVTGPGTASSDIYFIQVRPFDQKYTQSQQGGGGGGGGDEAQENLSKQQKEIISATFKLIRDKATMDPKEYVDGVKSLALVQGRLQAQAQGLVERLRRRGAPSVSNEFSKLTEYLQNAIGSMESAAVSLGAQKPSDALPEEQKALQQLLRAESLFREIQVSFGSQGGGGKGQSNAEDLADLFELELNKLKNQYETVQRGEQQERDEKVDEALQRLKELAQRQQQLNERNRMMGARGGSSSASSGAGQSQQQLMDEAEMLKRQLQRLSRERSSPELNNASNQLQKAIDEMKKAIDRSQRGNSAEAGSQGIRALQQLDDAKRSLAQGQKGNLEQGMAQAVEESKKLVEEQKRIQEGLDRLAQDKNGAGSPDSQRSREDLGARKSLLADQVKNLGNKIHGLSKETRKDQKATSGKLEEAAQFIRDKRLPERILSGNPLLENGAYDQLKPREDFIRGSLEELNKQLEAAKNGLGETKEGKLGQAVNKTRELAEGLESMRNRMRNLQRGAGSPGDQQTQQRGQEGQGRQSGQAGQPSQSAQAGRQPGGTQDSQGSQGRGEQAPGSSQAAGRPGSQPGTREGTPGADVVGMTGNASGPPNAIGRSRDEDIRQFQREGQQRLMDAQELRRLMNGNPTQTRNLDQVIESLQSFRKMTDANYSDPERIARLKASIDLLHNLEADLSRDLERLTQQEKYFYAEDSEAPANYKKLVEEYYKALAKGK